MKSILFLIKNIGFSLLLICCLACSDSNKNDEVNKVDREENTDGDTQENEGGGNANTNDWTLVFEEEFDGNNLDEWNIWSGGAFNNEIQLYNQEQLNIENGLLTILAQKKPVTGDSSPFDTTPKNFDYVSGRIECKTLFGPSDAEGEREYRIISRIKLPSGNGMWPAFWTYTDPWPTKGEIDILEARGNQTNRFQSNIFYGTEVNVPLNKNEDTAKSHQLDVNLALNFNTYELIWKANSLEILFDGQLLHTYNADSKNFVAELFGNKHQIVLNLAVGGGFFEGVNPNGFVNTSFMQVDWVKVYKR
jgi:beta-glucanase (GH16 family)